MAKKCESKCDQVSLLIHHERVGCDEGGAIDEAIESGARVIELANLGGRPFRDAAWHD